MLTWTDDPTIRHAILKRLDLERGVELLEVKITPHPKATPRFIAVGVLARIDHTLDARSLFHLTWSLEIGHLRNEIDENAEALKAARKDHFGRVFRGQLMVGDMQRTLVGNGLRGNWGKYG